MTNSPRISTPNLLDDLAKMKEHLRSLEQRATSPEQVVWTLIPMKTSAGWNNYQVVNGGSWAWAGYYQDRNGIVHLRGLIRNSDSAAIGNFHTTAFTLPVGVRPDTHKIFNCAAGSYQSARLDVNADGTMLIAGYPGGGAYGTYISLEGVTWVAGEGD